MPVVKAALGFLKVTGNAYVEVYVDGVKVGAAPYDQQIKPGAHAIRLVSPGPPARAKTQTLSVSAGTHHELFFDVEKNEIVSQKR